MNTPFAILFILVSPFATATAVRAQPVETELAGGTAEVVDLRQNGGVLRLAVRFANSGT